MKENQTRRIIKKYAFNSFSGEIAFRFLHWLLKPFNESEKEKAFFSVWTSCSTAKPDQTTEYELKRLHAHLSTQKRLYLRKKIIPIVAVAAFILLPCLGVTLMFWKQRQSESYHEIQLQECFVAQGDCRRIVLPDGSVAWLNAGSTLIYPKAFVGKTRSLFLSGEGNFNVIKNPHKPFIVKTQYLDIEALGTTFNVNSYSDASCTLATLEEGKIKVTIKDSLHRPPYILLPDEQLCYSQTTGNIERHIVDSKNIASWKSGFLCFERTPFNQIIRSIERHYDVSVVYNKTKYSERLLTVKFKSEESIYMVMQILQGITKGLKYEIKDNVIIIQ